MEGASNRPFVMEKEEMLKRLGEHVKKSRGSRSQRDCAYACGIHPNRWCDIESGRYDPRFLTLAKMSNVGIEFDDFLKSLV